MAQIRPFAAVRFSSQFGADVSNLIAPPYDVLDERQKTAMVARDKRNIVTIDLPHLPAKSVGPDSTYAQAGQWMRQWLAEGVLVRDKRTALYPYTQTYTHGERQIHRRGFFALVRLSPFGQGQVVPHEKTYPDAIVDRLKLTHATQMQMSPIFGLFSDPKNVVTSQLYSGLGRPMVSGTINGVQNDLWMVTDSGIENAAIDYLREQPIYIADGHHRYTMALQYQKDAAAANGGVLPPDHPANFALFALVSLQDDGLVILPTHRIIGGLREFSIGALTNRLGKRATVKELGTGPEQVAGYADDALPKRPPHTFGLYDGKSQKLYEIHIVEQDVLATLEPGQSEDWRSLDVAILQRFLLDEVITPTFGGGNITRSYTAYGSEVTPMTDGAKNQIALLLQPTPLRALEALSKHNEVMPQKSTFFYPKIATGMVLNSVADPAI